MNAEQLQAIKARRDAMPVEDWDALLISKDIDALIAEVERLTQEVARLMEAGRAMQEERDGWREEAETVRKNERSLMGQLGRESARADALAAELAGYKRHAAYVAECVDSDGAYKP